MNDSPPNHTDHGLGTAPSPGLLPEVWIAVFYVVVAKIWIGLYLTKNVRSKSEACIMQPLKVLNFEPTALIFLFRVLPSALGGRRRADRSRQRVSHGLRPTDMPSTVEIDTPLAATKRKGDTAAFRIIPESLTPVAQHANAAKVSTNISAAGGFLEMRIPDDGDGINAAAVDDPKSFGLLGMREKAEDIGGTLTVRGLPEKGIEVLLTMPLPKPTTLP